MDAPTHEFNLRIAPATDSVESEAIEHEEWRSLFHAENVGDATSVPSPEPQPFVLARFDHDAEAGGGATTTLIVELGRGHIASQTIAEEAIVLLDRSVDAPLDVVCDGRVIARGIPIVVRGKVALQITERIED